MNFEGVSLKKSFWRFVWPSVLAQWIFALYTMVDGMFVARGVSEVALSAVNIASPFVNFLFSVSILFAVGTSTIVAIFLGQGKHREANQANTQNLAVSGLIALMIMAAVWLCLDPLVMFLGATESTVGYVRQYILSILPFTWFFISSYTFETLVKTDGYPRFAAIAVTTGALTNCVLDYLFVMVFHWGIGGAGVATGISQMLTVFLYLRHFLSEKATIRFAKPDWNFGQFCRVVKIGLSSGLTELSAGFTVFMFNHAILRCIGEQGIVSYTIIAYEYHRGHVHGGDCPGHPAVNQLLLWKRAAGGVQQAAQVCGYNRCGYGRNRIPGIHGRRGWDGFPVYFQKPGKPEGVLRGRVPDFQPIVPGAGI